MLICKLKAKIHRIQVTSSDLDYEGSIIVGEDIFKAAGMSKYEKVLVGNNNNGNRWETYILPGEYGVCELNGAGARMALTGDVLIIMSYALYKPSEKHKPRIVLVEPATDGFNVRLNKVREIK